jgi:hypothetical protein
MTLLLASETSSRLVHLSPVDLVIIVFYFGLVLAIGFYLKGRSNTGEDFFMAGREMTAWIAGLSFLSANLGALELMGWAGAAYQYGILAAHWYWIGAIPAMLFLALVMMPFYYISKTHSVPGYLKLRFGESSRALSSVSFAFMTVLMSGINMYSMALVLKIVLGWNINFSIIVSSATVAIYVTLGGLRSAIFNEVLQFILIWAGALLIPILGLIDAGGWSGLKARIATNASAEYTHLWSTLGRLDGNRLRTWRDYFVRLLDHGFSGCAARSGGKGSSLREDGADYWSGIQDDCAVHRDSARAAGHRSSAHEVDLGSASDCDGRPQLQRSAASDAGALLRSRIVRTWNYGADCGIYVGDGRQCERVYDCLDL